MTSFKLTCTQALNAPNDNIIRPSNSAQQAAGVPVANCPLHNASQTARPPASVCLARFPYNASAEDIFKYTGTNAAFLCLSLTELAS